MPKYARLFTPQDEFASESHSLHHLTPYSLRTPDPYGQTGVVLSQLDSSATDDEISDALNLALLTHQERTSEAPVHITNGRRRGIFWKTQIPVTDPGRGGPAPNQRRRP